MTYHSSDKELCGVDLRVPGLSVVAGYHGSPDGDSTDGVGEVRMHRVNLTNNLQIHKKTLSGASKLDQRGRLDF